MSFIMKTIINTWAEDEQVSRSVIPSPEAQRSFVLDIFVGYLTQLHSTQVCSQEQGDLDFQTLLPGMEGCNPNTSPWAHHRHSKCWRAPFLSIHLSVGVTVQCWHCESNEAVCEWLFRLDVWYVWSCSSKPLTMVLELAQVPLTYAAIGSSLKKLLCQRRADVSRQGKEGTEMRQSWLILQIVSVPGAELSASSWLEMPQRGQPFSTSTEPQPMPEEQGSTRRCVWAQAFAPVLPECLSPTSETIWVWKLPREKSWRLQHSFLSVRTKGGWSPSCFSSNHQSIKQLWWCHYPWHWDLI